MAEVESYEMEISWSKIQVMYTSEKIKCIQYTGIIKKMKKSPTEINGYSIQTENQ